MSDPRTLAAEILEEKAEGSSDVDEAELFRQVASILRDAADEIEKISLQRDKATGRCGSLQETCQRNARIKSHLARENKRLHHYAGLLAWIMSPEDDRIEVEQTAMHVWRVELTKDQHEQLQQYLPADLRDGDDQ